MNINIASCNFQMGNTLMLRGFAEFIQWKHIKNSNDDRTANIVLDIVAFIKQNNYDTIVWDGDLYRSDSFTHVVFELIQNLPSTVQFVSFKSIDSFEKFKKGDTKNCEIGWEQMLFNSPRQIYCVPVSLPSGLKWFEKNSLLTQKIYSSVIDSSSTISIMYLGGGRIISDEMSNLRHTNNLKDTTRVYFIDIPRASFSISNGVPQCITQYLGNSNHSIDPLNHLIGFSKVNEHQEIYLEYSVTKCISEYAPN